MKTKFNSKPSRKHVSTQTEQYIQKRVPSPIHVVKSHKKPKKSFKSRNTNEIDTSVTTLDEKIRRFQESFINTSDETLQINTNCAGAPKNHFYSIPGIIETPTRPPMTPTINLNDLLSQQKQPKQQFFAPATPNSVISQTPSISSGQIPATPTCFLTPASTCTSNSVVMRDTEDEIEQKIMQELNEMFGEDEKDPVEDIFGEAVAPTQVTKVKRVSKALKNVAENDKMSAGEDSPVIDLQTLSKMKDPEQEEKEMKEKLMSSIWPCELHHQRMRLRTVLSDIADRNFRKYEKVCLLEVYRPF